MPEAVTQMSKNAILRALNWYSYLSLMLSQNNTNEMEKRRKIVTDLHCDRAKFGVSP
jgi:hypothetical protein